MGVRPLIIVLAIGLLCGAIAMYFVADSWLNQIIRSFTAI